VTAALTGQPTSLAATGRGERVSVRAPAPIEVVGQTAADDAADDDEHGHCDADDGGPASGNASHHRGGDGQDDRAGRDGGKQVGRGGEDQQDAGGRDEQRGDVDLAKLGEAGHGGAPRSGQGRC